MYQGDEHTRNQTLFPPLEATLCKHIRCAPLLEYATVFKESLYFSRVPLLRLWVTAWGLNFYDWGVSRSDFVNISCEDGCPVSSFIKLNGDWLESQTEQTVKSKEQKIRHTGSQGGSLLLLSHKLLRKSGCHGFFGCTKSERQKRDRGGNQQSDVWVLLILLIIRDCCLNAFLSSIDLCTLWSIPATWSDFDINTWCSPLVHTVGHLLSFPVLLFLSASTTTAK